MSISTSFSSGFQMGYNATSSWKRRKEDKAAIDKVIEENKTNAMELARRYDMDRADGVITQKEYEDSLSYWIPLSNEWMDRATKLYDKSRSMTSEQLTAEIEELQSMYEIYKDTDYQDVGAMKELVSGFKFEKARFQGEAYIKALEGRGQEASKTETFNSFRECKEAYPNVEPKFDAKSGTFVPGDEIKTKTYEYQSKMEDQDKMLASGEIDLAEWKKMRTRLLGGAASVEGGYKQPSLGQIQTMEQGMLDAKNLDDLHNKLRQWEGANLDPEKIKVYDKQWTDYQTDKRTKALESTIKQLGKLLGGKGTLRPTDEFDLYVNKKKYTRTKQDWYKGLFEQYNRQLDELAKVMDVSDYKKLISPKEIKAVGWNLDIFTEGIEMKDWKGIWQ